METDELKKRTGRKGACKLSESLEDQWESIQREERKWEDKSGDRIRSVF